METDALTDIGNALMRLRAAFRKHGLEPPVSVCVADSKQMINLAGVLRDSTRLDVAADLDAARLGDMELSVNVCGIKIKAEAGPDMRRVKSIAFFTPPGLGGRYKE